MEVNVITIENGKEYVIMDIIVNDNGRYLILVNENDQYDMCVRKVIIEDGKEFITKLESDKELDEVMMDFHIKHDRKGNENEE